MRSYTLIEFTPPDLLWPDRDRVVRFMEYVRANAENFVPGIPVGCEFHLLASGHAHNEGIVPLLGLWCPRPGETLLPDHDWLAGEISKWCAGLSRLDVESIVANTPAPTWDELVLMRVHPIQNHEG